MSKKVRLVKVQVHPEFVVDDGDTLAPLEAFGLQSPPVPVTPAEWPTFATGRFAQAVDALEQQLNEPSVDQAGSDQA